MASSASIRIHAPLVGVRLRPEGCQTIADEHMQSETDAAFARGVEHAAELGIENGVAALGNALTKIEAAAERAQEELAAQAVELAVHIARLLLKIRIESGDHDLDRIVRSALADAEVGRGNCTVHLHPEDHSVLIGQTFRAGTKLEADSTLLRGDVHISTTRGLLVRDLESALDSIREQLLEDLAR